MSIETEEESKGRGLMERAKTNIQILMRRTMVLVSKMLLLFPTVMSKVLIQNTSVKERRILMPPVKQTSNDSSSLYKECERLLTELVETVRKAKSTTDHS